MLHDATYKFMNNDIIQSSVSIKIAYKISDTPVTGRLAIVAARAVDMAPPKRWVILLSGVSIVMVPDVDILGRWQQVCA